MNLRFCHDALKSNTGIPRWYQYNSEKGKCYWSFFLELVKVATKNGLNINKDKTE